MTRHLLISGSPRNGNTDFVLRSILKRISGDKELILLRDKNIKHCIGCSRCHYVPECVLEDDMAEILKKMKESDVIVIGTPNYFDNVSGLLKDFIDRTHPFYKPGILEGKKLVLIMIGGEKTDAIRRFLSETTFGFVKYQKLDLIGSFCISADSATDFSANPNHEKIINQIMADIENSR